MMNRAFTGLSLLLLTLAGSAQAGSEIESWQSTMDMSRLLSPGPAGTFGEASGGEADAVVSLDPSRRYQTMLGIGASLESSTCYNLSRLSTEDRDEVLVKLLDPVKGIGMSLMRICIGTSDFTGDPWYSYCDLPAGETDSELKHFSIEKDRAHILPVLKRARELGPDLLFIAAPWSPPAWMKSGRSLIGGRLLPEFYPDYARYFVRFLKAYEAEGIPIHAVTPQNEPGVDLADEAPKWHYPSCRYTGSEERDFIKGQLGPMFEREGIKTEIWCYDHNYNERTLGDDEGLPHPRVILSDPEAARFVKGTAFHGYAGKPDGMKVFHDEFSGKPVYFTEGSTYGVGGASRICTLMRNMASSYNAWVTILDENGKPNNGPFEADRTCITYNTKTRKPEYNFDYFMYGQFSKFIRRGAVRIEAGEGSATINHVAVVNPDGRVALIVTNGARGGKTVRIKWNNESFDAELPGRSVTTFTWKG